MPEDINNHTSMRAAVTLLLLVSLASQIFLYQKISLVEQKVSQAGVPFSAPIATDNPQVSLEVVAVNGSTISGHAHYADPASGATQTKEVQLIVEKDTFFDMGSLAALAKGDRIVALTKESVVSNAALHVIRMAVMRPR